MQIKDINQCVQQILAAMPPGLKNLPENMQEHLRVAIQGTLNKMDIVTREEFDAQVGVLQKTRSKLEQLEKRIKEIEGLL